MVMTLFPQTLAEGSSQWGAHDTFLFEREAHCLGYQAVAGTDEVGRGPLAGPVVAASVILPTDCDYRQFQDSKTLSPQQRRRLVGVLEQIGAIVGLGFVSEQEIDRLNILQASLLAMKKSIMSLTTQPDFLLVDGKFQVPVDLTQRVLIKGDSRSASIAAASIAAKVARDELMQQYHDQYPQYAFCQNMGYPTLAHRQALAKYGPCPLHRRSFRGVKEFFVASDD